MMRNLNGENESKKGSFDPDQHRSNFVRGFFERHAQKIIRKSFHALRISRNGPAPRLPKIPVVIYLNHPSWWDPMVGIALSRLLYSDRRHYVPIASEMLEKYKFLRRLGFFGVDSTRRGTTKFLRTVDLIFKRNDAVLWITPTGKFNDPRERPVVFEKGIGHLAERASKALLIPMALEYPFWDERYPEALVRFGPGTRVEDRQQTGEEWRHYLEKTMVDNQEALRAEVVTRNPDHFATLLTGSAGIGGIYDIWRSMVARLRGEEFKASHGDRE